MTFDKKVYTMEDNVKSISFGIKDLVKGMESLDNTLQQIKSAWEQNSPTPQKQGDDNTIPF